MNNIFPLLFVILWSSAFITSKVIVDNASPFASLSFRFAIVAIGFLIFSTYLKEKINVSIKQILESCFSGILFHGLYLGGVFYAISEGLSPSITALIVSMQPIFTNILAGPILNEKITWKQWIGISLAFIGVIMVLGYDIGDNIPIIGLISSFIALLGGTIATIWQKKISGKLHLSVNNFYQAIGAFVFLSFSMIVIEQPYIIFNYNFIWAMVWQIVAVSFGAFTILMYLIKINSASKTSNLYFLIPPVSALMAWIFLKEVFTLYDFYGLLICSSGVYIATRNEKLYNT
jgi:drug/metabolite transporter (DMT)-like permease